MQNSSKALLERFPTIFEYLVKKRPQNFQLLACLRKRLCLHSTYCFYLCLKISFTLPLKYDCKET